MQARLRAQLGDRSKYSGERRRRSVVVASIVLTITDPLRGSYPFWCYLQAALIRSCGALFACMELTMISRFQRLQTSTKSLLHSLFLYFSVISPSACFQGVDTLRIASKHAEGMSLRFDAICALAYCGRHNSHNSSHLPSKMSGGRILWSQIILLILKNRSIQSCSHVLLDITNYFINISLHES